MPIGWMTVLKLTPWAEVIKNAPAVAEAARKLWGTAGRQAGTPDAGTAPAPPTAVDTPAAALQQRVDAAEATVATLQEQMQASSLLLNALAEQNAELIRRVESHRVRILWLAGLVIVFGAIAALNLAVTFSR